jgi:hypothetical protein
MRCCFRITCLIPRWLVKVTKTQKYIEIPTTPSDDAPVLPVLTRYQNNVASVNQ